CAPTPIVSPSLRLRDGGKDVNERLPAACLRHERYDSAASAGAAREIFQAAASAEKNSSNSSERSTSSTARRKGLKKFAQRSAARRPHASVRRTRVAGSARSGASS